MLYVLTVSGVALMCHLRSPFSYVSGSVLHQDDIVEFNLQTQAQSAKVTAVTAKPGCIVIGRQDGSICSYSLGKLAPNSPGMSFTVNSQQQTHRSRDLVGSRLLNSGPSSVPLIRSLNVIVFYCRFLE